jgi:hypothetical protein
VIIGQRRVSTTNRSTLLKAHKLSFGSQQIDLDRPYIFTGLGDELPGLPGCPCPDLHITFRSVRDWDSVLKKGSFAGFDHDVTVPVSLADIREGKRIVYDFERDRRVQEEGGEGKPRFGVSVEMKELGGLFVGEGEQGGRTYLNLGTGKKGRGEGRALGFRLIGVGPEIPGYPFNADINVNFVLKS